MSAGPQVTISAPFHEVPGKVGQVEGCDIRPGTGQGATACTVAPRRGREPTLAKNRGKMTKRGNEVAKQRRVPVAAVEEEGPDVYIVHEEISCEPWLGALAVGPF